MTLSIAARCPATGHLGIALASSGPQFGPARSCLAEAGAGAVASHSTASEVLARRLIELLRDGVAAPKALDLALATERGRDRYQVVVVDALGRAAAFTGSDTHDWQGHRTGPGWAASGNALARGWVVDEMGAAFESNAHLDLDERLLAALEAGIAAGGDRRGHRSAELRIATGVPSSELALRVHDGGEPAAELRRLLHAYHEHQRALAARRRTGALLA